MAVNSALRYYFGLAKEVTKGTAVAPVTFPRWLDGSLLIPKISSERVLEGDGGRDASFTLKKIQEYEAMLLHFPRPIEMGQVIAAAMGTACDAVSGSTPTNATTLAALAPAGQAFISSTATFAPASIIQIDTTAGGLAEVRTVTTVTGAGPFTVNFALALVRAHQSGVAAANVVAPYTHTLTPQNTPDYFAIEAGLSSGDLVTRVADCLVEEITIEGQFGQPIKVATKWAGISGANQGTVATVTTESGQPMLFQGGTFNVNGAGSVYDEKFKVVLKNITDRPQTSAVTLQDLIWGRRTIDVDMDVLFFDSQLYKLMFWGAVGGAADSITVGNGSIDFTFLQGGVATTGYSAEFKVPSIDYIGDGPTPKLDGKAFRYTIKAFGTHGAAAIVSALVTNSQLAAYS